MIFAEDTRRDTLRRFTFRHRIPREVTTIITDIADRIGDTEIIRDIQVFRDTREHPFAAAPSSKKLFSFSDKIKTLQKLQKTTKRTRKSPLCLHSNIELITLHKHKESKKLLLLF